ncbi:response regulator [Streptosporangium roseum]|uniref:Response regulator receiver protein n=1 Tax=Streptosporangium roseum (strain ATCC 12428 / DSM 43021 / JCM 3005 / KCTC 9067 / NCIMB 10171 / NRRL 2505 / NI 9100) TaxID=479432 RepID=D2AWG3_STRRD|nr:response regulator transcription factor [Streptosporangium roseum]ACZ86959.1 response regulator receiver protein [Streptosporangium roseum DSM 43021]
MRVILAEDSTLLREGLVRLLVEEGHEVLAAVGDGTALIEAVDEHGPDIVVADVRMPPTHTDEGLRAVLEIRRRRPGTRVLVLSQYVEKHYATELMSGDVDGVGYLLKDRVAQIGDFLDALDRVGAGGAAFDPEVVRQLLARTTHVDPLSRLTPRERDVLDHMAQGCTNASIAEQLVVSQSAVEKHVNSIFDKLGLLHVTGYSRRVLAVLRYLGS